VLHREPFPQFPVPSVVAIIDLAEEFSMLSNVIECDSGDVRIGMRVGVCFSAITEAISLPLFKPI
jgi:hypothetical protein